MDPDGAVHRDHEALGLGGEIGQRRPPGVDVERPEPGAGERQAVREPVAP